LSAILPKSSLALALSSPAVTPEANSRTADASASRLTMRECEGRVARRSGTTAAHLHDFKTTVAIAGSAVRVR
jgi:hypothetical protein